MLVEVHDGDELQSALAAGAEIVGINNRDLRDFSVDMERTARLMEQDPGVGDGRLGVGDRDRRAAATGCKAAGVQAVLVGESLMRAPDPAAALRALTAPGDRAGVHFRSSDSAL